MPATVSEFYAGVTARGAAAEAAWNATFAAYSEKVESVAMTATLSTHIHSHSSLTIYLFFLGGTQHAELAASYTRRMNGELPPDAEWVDKLPGNPAVSNV